MPYGKYRAKVVDIEDPFGLGRIRAIVPAVSELPLTWALPCAPDAGPGLGLFAVPPVGANVWIEFEEVNVDFPIWSGCFWGEAGGAGGASPSHCPGAEDRAGDAYHRRSGRRPAAGSAHAGGRAVHNRHRQAVYRRGSMADGRTPASSAPTPAAPAA